MCTVWHINGNNDKTKNENVGNNSSTNFKFFLTILRHDFNSVQSFKIDKWVEIPTDNFEDENGVYAGNLT